VRQEGKRGKKIYSGKGTGAPTGHIRLIQQKKTTGGEGKKKRFQKDGEGAEAAAASQSFEKTPVEE